MSVNLLCEPSNFMPSSAPMVPVDPMLPSQTNGAFHLVPVKRPGQQIVCAKIQHLRPEPLVGDPGSDYQGRRVLECLDRIQKVLPGSVWQMLIAHHHGRKVTIHQLERCPATLSATRVEAKPEYWLPGGVVSVNGPDYQQERTAP
jgi:hypothetical protein